MTGVIDLEQLRQARGERSLKDVAEQIGVTRQQIWNYENGVSEPPVSILIKLADYYGLQIQDLILQKNFV